MLYAFVWMSHWWITQKKAYKIQNTAEVWNKEYIKNGKTEVRNRSLYSKIFVSGDDIYWNK
jgi:hypothetical protein